MTFYHDINNKPQDVTTMSVSTLSFYKHYQGKFINLLRWAQLDEVWEKVSAQPEGWYIYFVNDTVPTVPVTANQLTRFIEEIDQLLRQEHDYDYCGIVYVDDKEDPKMIKIFDPNNLGAVCGSSGTVVLPRWLLTRLPPQVITDEAPVPANRRRWWQQLFLNKA
jgi:hypothetical protein